jgi:putative redox protein
MNGYLTEVNNGRGHTVNMDLPSYQNGEDTAATAVEYMVMGYAGCTVTIFKIIADRMRLNIDSVEINVEAEKPGEMETVTKMVSVLSVVTSEPEEKIHKALEMTRKTCPVGRIYDMAKIPADIELRITRPE